MDSSERRESTSSPTRGRSRFMWDLAFTSVRWVAAHARNVYATFGILILGGLFFGVVLTYGFAKIAGKVVSGKTTGFDEAAMKFMGAHQIPWISNAMVEVTTL